MHLEIWSFFSVPEGGTKFLYVKFSKLERLAVLICERIGPVQGSKSPKSGKDGFGVKKLPFPNAPEKGALSPKIPFFLAPRISVFFLQENLHVYKITRFRGGGVGFGGGECRFHFYGRGDFLGLDPSWLDLAFSGRPDFRSRGPKIQILKGVGTSGLGTGNRGHYKKGLFTGEISRISKISRFSRISRKWLGFSIILHTLGVL